MDNPINWSFRVGRVFDITVRVHIIFVICAVTLIAMEMPDRDDPFAPSLMRSLVNAAGTYVILFVIVLLHEFGHCFGARSTGGEADEVLLWPLGGLAYTRPRHNARAHMITTLAGPAVNVVVCVLCAVALVLWTGRFGSLPLNPIHPTIPIGGGLWSVTEPQLWVMRVFAISYLLLLFNLLPIFPFDGGRVVQAWLWPVKGYYASMDIATGTGMVGAIGVGLFALFIEDSWLMLGIAAFGYLTCWQTRRALREQVEFGEGTLGYDFSRGYTSLQEPQTHSHRPGVVKRWRARRVVARAERERRREKERADQLEDVLRKVSRSGVNSLSFSERRVLENETRRRQSSPGGHEDR